MLFSGCWGECFKKTKKEELFSFYCWYFLIDVLYVAAVHIIDIDYHNFKSHFKQSIFILHIKAQL